MVHNPDIWKGEWYYRKKRKGKKGTYRNRRTGAVTHKGVFGELEERGKHYYGFDKKIPKSEAKKTYKKKIWISAETFKDRGFKAKFKRRRKKGRR